MFDIWRQCDHCAKVIVAAWSCAGVVCGKVSIGLCFPLCIAYPKRSSSVFTTTTSRKTAVFCLHFESNVFVHVLKVWQKSVELFHVARTKFSEPKEGCVNPDFKIFSSRYSMKSVVTIGLHTHAKDNKFSSFLEVRPRCICYVIFLLHSIEFSLFLCFSYQLSFSCSLLRVSRFLFTTRLFSIIINGLIVRVWSRSCMFHSFHFRVSQKKIFSVYYFVRSCFHWFYFQVPLFCYWHSLCFLVCMQPRNIWIIILDVISIRHEM